MHGYTPHKDPMKKTDFLRLLNILRQKYHSIEESNTLDINKQVVTLKKTLLSNIRVSIEGVQNIQRYCKTNKISRDGGDQRGGAGGRRGRSQRRT